MLKWVLLGAVAALFYFWLKRPKLAAAPVPAPPRITEPLPIVPCAYCGVHLPAQDCLEREQRFYCCSAHCNELDPAGWYGLARWRPSPNFDARPTGIQPELVLIHHISLPPGQFGQNYIGDFFQNKLDPTAHPYFAEIAAQKVSSHFLIERNGLISQFVSVQQRAWHAGESDFLGRKQCNDFAIGVELEGDGETAFTDAQYVALAQLIKVLGNAYTHLSFAGHSDVAPKRKVDPGRHFDWQRLQRENHLLQEQLPFGLEFRA
ncbi:1,6-anhydro-N-acetylmuramyl-L-alanine amidase AmpD [Polynucleobacter sp. IMCC 29146]|uniref:1,6-anhydro-N-acetylmuramyl-L-alanine amidase AmpD n=1 Tax=Polynucleobacter sp. IMCC 29146 TaxID=2780953 RepID=UPI001F44BC4F|nr:1,6-anhydro-N-acetylmuramyl-L-alanine amidase AmpD [Polynucleobacter sp. IMCC 29146]MCE7528395.1 1,6-anhydro-N-acetylmuramyl-L-alanine amidase AmpD [Polynucleobacter sp. IMCC 29146]